MANKQMDKPNPTTVRTREPRRSKEQGGTFRILIGIHTGDGPPGCGCEHCETSGGKAHIYAARRYDRQGMPLDPPDYVNDIIESPKADLVGRFNSPNSIKFERVGAGGVSVDPDYVRRLEEQNKQFQAQLAGQQSTTAQGQPVNAAADSTVAHSLSKPIPQFDQMTVADLKSYAAAEEIDLGSARSHAEVLKMVKAATAAKTSPT